MVEMPDIAAIASGMPVMSALFGADGCVRASIVTKARSGAISTVLGGARHMAYPSTTSCRRLSALICWWVALPVASIRVVHMVSQAFMRSAVKPRRFSDSSTTRKLARNSSSASIRVACAWICSSKACSLALDVLAGLWSLPWLSGVFMAELSSGGWL